MRAILLWCVLGLAGCGSDDSTDVCAQRVGTYRAHYTDLDGNCGAMPDEVQTLTHQPNTAELPSMGCSGTITYSEDNCTMAADMTCLVPTGKRRTSSNATWTRDGSVGRSTLWRWEIDGNGNVSCQGKYRVDMSRL